MFRRLASRFNLHDIILCFIIVVCLFTFFPLQAIIPLHIDEMKRILKKEVESLEAETPLRVFGIGGSFQDKINSLELAVELKSPLSFARIRSLYILTLGDWILQVNSDIPAIPYFKNYPMKLTNFEFRMLTTDYHFRSRADDPVVCFIFNIGDKIVYCFRNESTGSLEPFLRESFTDGWCEITRKIWIDTPIP